MKSEWVIRNLGEIAEVKGGKRVPKGYLLQTEPTDHPYIRVTDFNNLGSIDLDDIHYVNEVTFNEIRNYTIGVNDIYISIAGTIGKTGMIPEELDGANLTENACKLVFKPGFYPRFVYYFTQSSDFQDQAGLNTRTTAMPKLALIRLATIRINIPPLPEQHRIVAILDEVFDSITRAKGIAEQNLRNTRELFESYMHNVFDNPIKKWEERKLGVVCEISMGQSPDGSTYNSKGIGMPLINGPVEFGPDPFSETIRSKFTTQPTKTCRKGDLILCVRGSTTGRINIAGFDACIGRGVASIRYEKCQAWINYFVLANRSKIYEMGTGSTFPNVSSQLISSLMVPMPAISEQQSIVDDLNAISIEVKKLESIYQQKLTDLEDLKKSVLEKAFNGELISD